MSLRSRHCERVIVFRSLLWLVGPRKSSCPLAQASKLLPDGFVSGAKPFSLSIISGKPFSNAARIMAFSPGDIAGETSTAPCWHCSRASSVRTEICSSVSLLEHCTCTKNGFLSRKRLPIAEKVIPFHVMALCTRKNSGCCLFTRRRRGLSAR